MHAVSRTTSGIQIKLMGPAAQDVRAFPALALGQKEGRVTVNE
jgi:hypothetical protein